MMYSRDKGKKMRFVKGKGTDAGERAEEKGRDCENVVPSRSLRAELEISFLLPEEQSPNFQRRFQKFSQTTCMVRYHQNTYFGVTV